MPYDFAEGIVLLKILREEIDECSNCPYQTNLFMDGKEYWACRKFKQIICRKGDTTQDFPGFCNLPNITKKLDK